MEDVKAVIRAVLTRWTMHYQAFRRLGELRDVINVVIRDDERKPVKDRNLITGNTRAKAKAAEMVNLIKTSAFWDALAVYVVTGMLVAISHLIIGWALGWNNILSRSLSLRTRFRQHIAAWTLFFSVLDISSKSTVLWLPQKIWSGVRPS